MRISELMKTDIITIAPGDTLDHAYHLMRECAIRHLPVVDSGELVGVLSEGDILLQAMPDSHLVMVPEGFVRDAMSTDIVTCAPDSRLGEVAATMLACKLDCLPVTEGDLLVGLVTSSDFLEMICDREDELSGAILPFTNVANDGRRHRGDSSNDSMDIS